MQGSTSSAVGGASPTEMQLAVPDWIAILGTLPPPSPPSAANLFGVPSNDRHLLTVVEQVVALCRALAGGASLPAGTAEGVIALLRRRDLNAPQAHHLCSAITQLTTHAAHATGQASAQSAQSQSLPRASVIVRHCWPARGIPPERAWEEVLALIKPAAHQQGCPGFTAHRTPLRCPTPAPYLPQLCTADMAEALTAATCRLVRQPGPNIYATAVAVGAAALATNSLPLDLLAPHADQLSAMLLQAAHKLPLVKIATLNMADLLDNCAGALGRLAHCCPLAAERVVADAAFIRAAAREAAAAVRALEVAARKLDRGSVTGGCSGGARSGTGTMPGRVQEPPAAVRQTGMATNKVMSYLTFFAPLLLANTAAHKLEDNKDFVAAAYDLLRALPVLGARPLEDNLTGFAGRSLWAGVMTAAATIVRFCLDCSGSTLRTAAADMIADGGGAAALVHFLRSNDISLRSTATRLLLYLWRATRAGGTRRALDALLAQRGLPSAVISALRRPHARCVDANACVTLCSTLCIESPALAAALSPLMASSPGALAAATQLLACGAGAPLLAAGAPPPRGGCGREQRCPHAALHASAALHLLTRVAVAADYSQLSAMRAVPGLLDAAAGYLLAAESLGPGADRLITEVGRRRHVPQQ